MKINDHFDCRVSEVTISFKAAAAAAAAAADQVTYTGQQKDQWPFSL
jgi:hypothetical protein